MGVMDDNIGTNTSGREDFSHVPGLAGDQNYFAR
jgi:hypothetical protein